MKPTILYGGFSDGKLNWISVDDGHGGVHWRTTPALFRTRQEARVQYEDVRRVEVKMKIGQPRKPFRKRTAS